MLRRSFAVRLLSAAGILALGLTAQAAEPFPGKSPIGAAKRAPPAQDMFQGKLKPVPELVMRAELEAGAGIPYHPNAYDEIEQRIGAMRKNNERTHSGIWKHINVYYGYSRHYEHYAADENLIEFLKALENWRIASPQAPEPVIIAGIMLKGLARNSLRLETTKDVITPQRIELHMKRMLEARTFLLKHKDIGSNDPTWYSQVILTSGSLCETLPESWALAEEGSKRYPDFHPIYFSYTDAAAHCAQTTEAFGTEITKTINLAKERSGEPGEAMYARIRWYVHDVTFGAETFQFPGFDWNRMKAGMDDVLKQYNEPWNLNNFAKFACEKGDIEKARELLPKALELPVVSVWGSSQNFQSCWAWANSEASLDARQGKKQ